MASKSNTLLLVANWDSGVGYAWWLMESYWALLARTYHQNMKVVLAYPSISDIPGVIRQSPLQPVTMDFSRLGLKSLGKHLAFIRRHRVKVVYFSDKAPRHWVYPLFRLFGVRSILVHDHTPGERTEPTGVKRAIKWVLGRVPGYTADACIGATDYIRERYIRVGCMPPRKCFVVNNGIPLDLPDNKDAYPTFGIASGKKIIVTVGRANRYKGGFFALDVLARLKKVYDVDNWHYLYLGDGPDRESLISYAKKLGLQNNTTFPGRVETVKSYLQGASVAFHPSQGEVGYSLSILEYMLCGLPTVVPDNPSVCGATEHDRTGLIYEQGSAGSAANALQKLLQDDSASARIGDNAIYIVKTNYSLKKTHKTLLNVFDRYANKGVG